jgi:DNA-binding transcriptional ArsR family regulator
LAAEPPDPAAAVAAAERVFAALAHPSRRHILLTLQFRGGAMSAGEIAERFACSWPTTTRHLNILRAAGLVAVVRRGRERVYTLERDRLRAVVGEWLAWFGSENHNLPGSPTAPGDDKFL